MCFETSFFSVLECPPPKYICLYVHIYIFPCPVVEIMVKQIPCLPVVNTRLSLKTHWFVAAGPMMQR